MPIPEIWADHAERGDSEVTFKRIVRSLLEMRFLRIDRKDSRRRIMARGLHEVVIVSQCKGYGLHVVERETSDVDLPCLGVAKGHPIVGHSGVVRSQISDADRLHSSYSAIVAHIGTCEFLHRISQFMYSEEIDFFLSHHLHRLRCRDVAGLT